MDRYQMLPLGPPSSDALDSEELSPILDEPKNRYLSQSVVPLPIFGGIPPSNLILTIP